RRDLLRDGGQGSQGFVLPYHAPVESRVVERHRGAGSDQLDDAQVCVGEGVQLRGLDVNHADHAPAGDHGDSQLGPDGVHRVQVAGIATDVVYEHRLSASYRGARDTVADRDAQLGDQLFAMTDREVNAHGVTLLGHHQQGEDLE